MGYGAPQDLVNNGQLPETTRSFIFDSGTVGNSNFMAIAANAPHKAAALVAINEVVSPEMQLSIYENLGNISVLDMAKLPQEQRAQFENVPLGAAQIPLDELLDHRIAEASGPVIPILEKLWLEACGASLNAHSLHCERRAADGGSLAESAADGPGGRSLSPSCPCCRVGGGFPFRGGQWGGARFRHHALLGNVRAHIGVLGPSAHPSRSGGLGAI